MNYSMNMCNNWNNLIEIQNSIFIGGPKHLEVVDDDSYVLRYRELPSIDRLLYNPDIDLTETIETNVHNYHRVEMVNGNYRGHVYFHEDIDRDQYDYWLQSYYRLLLDRIRYDYYNRDHRFFNVPYERASANDNWDNPMIYAPYIPIEYYEFPYISDGEPWYPPAGLDRGKLKKETKKLQLELDEKLFEL